MHEGFEQALDAAAYQRLIAAIPHEASRILFTGHSLGAALASLAASRYHHVDHLYTFGSPRLGDQDFANSMAHVNHSRFVNCCDLVTTVPPELFGYRHFGTLHYIDRFGRVTIEPAEDLINADKLTAEAQYQIQHAFQRGRVPSRSLADHTPFNYVSATMGLRV
ncbi:MAG: hypothetical protein HYZ45_04650 [Burkholderiales bacterium]|nr:hypothetical protein [Burkholderiales bacterium]